MEAALRNVSLVLVIVVVSLFAIDAAGQQFVPAHAPYTHGALVDVPFIVEDGVLVSGKDHAFLAIYIGSVSSEIDSIDYQQDVDFLASPEGYVLREGGIIGRNVTTLDVDENGWVLLKLSKPCHAQDTRVTAGFVTVCPPRAADDVRLFACTNPANGIEPILAEVPYGTVSCVPSKRRAVRK